VATTGRTGRRAECKPSETDTIMRRLRNERGAALIETAVTLPLILLVSVGIFEFGRAYQTWQVLTNAAREGARIAVLLDTTDAQVTNTVRTYITDGGLPNAASTTVTVLRNEPLGATTGSRITVSYPFSFMVLNPVIRLVAPTSTTGNSITMQSSALMRNEG
jgi:Flp pilus assembly protein TadG